MSKTQFSENFYLISAGSTSGITWANAIAANNLYDSRGIKLVVKDGKVKTEDGKIICNSVRPVSSSENIQTSEYTSRDIFDVKILNKKLPTSTPTTITDALGNETFDELFTRKSLTSITLPSGKIGKFNTDMMGMLCVYETASSTTDIGVITEASGEAVWDTTEVTKSNKTFYEELYKLIDILGTSIWGSDAKISGTTGDSDGDVTGYTTWKEYIDAHEATWYLPESQDTGEDSNKYIGYADGKVWLFKTINEVSTPSHALYYNDVQINADDEFIDRATYRNNGMKALFIDGTSAGKVKETYFTGDEKSWSSWYNTYHPTYQGKTISRDSSTGALSVEIATGDTRFLVDETNTRINGNATTKIPAGTVMYFEAPLHTVTLKSCWQGTGKTFQVPEGQTWQQFINVQHPTTVNGTALAVTSGYVTVGTGGNVYSGSGYSTKVTSTSVISTDITVSDNEFTIYISGQTHITSGVKSTVTNYITSNDNIASWATLTNVFSNIKYNNTYPIARDFGTTTPYKMAVKDTSGNVLRYIYAGTYDSELVQVTANDAPVNGTTYKITNSIRLLNYNPAGTATDITTYKNVMHTSFSSWVQYEAPQYKGSAITTDSTGVKVCGGAGYLYNGSTSTTKIPSSTSFPKLAITTGYTDYYAKTAFTINGTSQSKPTENYYTGANWTWDTVMSKNLKFDGQTFGWDEDGSNYNVTVNNSSGGHEGPHGWWVLKDGNPIRGYITTAPTVIEGKTYTLGENPDIKTITFVNTYAAAAMRSFTATTGYDTFNAWISSGGGSSITITAIASGGYEITVTLFNNGGFAWLTLDGDSSAIMDSDGDPISVSTSIAAGATFYYRIESE